MKNWKRLLALPLSLALTVSLCACGPAGGDETAPPDPDASIEVDLTQDAVTFASGLSGDEILLTVNGEDVPANLFLYLLFMDCYNFEYHYYSYYGITVADFAGRLLEDAVDMTVYNVLLRQRAAELGCALTDEQRAEIEAGRTGENQTAYEQYKAAFGLTGETMDFISALDFYSDNLLSTIPAPTEEELNGYVYQVKHILLKTVDDNYEPLPDDEIAAQRALAEDILARLQAVEGEEQRSLFDELMNEFSEDPGLAAYPDGYEYTVQDSLVDGFTDAALALDFGEVSGIVETDYGYHIMLRGKVTDPESYADDCRAYQMDRELKALAETVAVTRASALDTLDVAAFYSRYIAYHDAYLAQNEDAVG